MGIYASYTDNDRALHKQLETVEQLCKIYFDIASDAIGESKVKELRDKKINEIIEQKRRKEQ